MRATMKRNLGLGFDDVRFAGRVGYSRLIRAVEQKPERR